MKNGKEFILYSRKIIEHTFAADLMAQKQDQHDTKLSKALRNDLECLRIVHARELCSVSVNYLQADN